MKLRKNLYLDRDVCDAIEALARRPGGNQSVIVSAGMREWLASRANRKLDDLLRLRLDRMTREIVRLQHDQNVHFEAFMLFVEHVLAVLPPLAEGDKAALASGRERYNRFFDRLTRKLADSEAKPVANDDGGPEQ